MVSKFYLTGFADATRQLRRVPHAGKPHLISVERATVVRDFYNVELPSGELSDVFERVFAQIEASAADVVRAIVGGSWPPNPTEKGALSTWVALQHLRGRSIRTGQTRMQAQMIKLIVGASGKEELRRHMGPDPVSWTR